MGTFFETQCRSLKGDKIAQIGRSTGGENFVSKIDQSILYAVVGA